MPFVAPAMPRKMLPPPTTTATSMPAAWTTPICSAMRSRTLGSMPYPASPMSASPESLSRTRLNVMGTKTLSRRMTCAGPAKRGAAWGTVRHSKRGGPGWDRLVSGVVASATAGLGRGTVIGLAEDPAREPDDRQRRTDGLGDLGEELRHGLVRVLHEGLLHEADLFVVLLQAAIGDLGLDGRGLACLGGLSHVDALLMLDDLRRDLIAGGVHRRRGGRVHGQVADQCHDLRTVDGGAGDLDEHADATHAVDVGADGGCALGDLEAGEASDAHVLAELGDLLAESLLDRQGRVALPSQGQQCGAALGQALGSVDGDLLGKGVGERRELRVASNEVSLAVDLDERRDLARRLDIGRDKALVRGAAGLLGQVRKALGAKDVHGAVHVARRLDERLLAVHHARAGGLAQGLDHGGGDLHRLSASSACLSTSAVRTEGCLRLFGYYSAAGSAAGSGVASAGSTATGTSASATGAATGAGASTTATGTSASATGAATGAGAAGTAAWTSGAWVARSMTARPSAAASAMTRVINDTARMASSLPGMT